MKPLTIYHNPRCSKSRTTLAMLQERGVEPKVIDYLKTPPTAAELSAIVKSLGMAPEQLVRQGEDVYKKKYAGKKLTDAEWIAAMVADPIVIERPIVISGKRAVLGRPPENIERLFED